jgi:hypothetical protein
MELIYYKATQEQVVIYNPQSKSLSIGRPPCFEVIFDGELKVKCELIPAFTDWLYQYVVKV